MENKIGRAPKYLVIFENGENKAMPLKKVQELLAANDYSCTEDEVKGFIATGATLKTLQVTRFWLDEVYKGVNA